MPEPQAIDTAGGDPMSMIYELMSKQRNNDMASGEAGVVNNRALEKAQMLKQADDLRKQEESKANAATWGIFAKIASVIAIAVSAVASAFTGGAATGLCVAACALSALAFAEGEAHILTDITHDPNVEKAFQVTVGILAAACSCGAGAANLVTGAAKTVIQEVGAGAQIVGASCQIGQQALSLDNDKGVQDFAMALGFAGAACSIVGSLGSIGTGVSKAAGAAASASKKVIQATAEVTSGVAEVGAGVAEVGSSEYQADATDRLADAKSAQLAIARLEQLTSLLIDGVKETDSSHERALQTLQGAMQTQAQTLVIASARV